MSADALVCEGESRNDSESDPEEESNSLLRECLEQQISEMELLLSMYTEEEFVFVDPNTSLANLRATFNSEKFSTATPLDLMLKLNIASGESGSTSAELTVNIPVEYPLIRRPSVIVRVSALSGSQSSAFNLDLKRAVVALPLGEPLITEIVQWVQDNFNSYWSENSKTLSPKAKPSPETFARFWIYSHHLYSKNKRRDILSLSSDFSLTGFSLPGKPGVICVEGAESNCKQFWNVIRCWNWKKLVIRHKEEHYLSEHDANLFEGLRKFFGFEEIAYVQNGTGRNYHMDMGSFNQYLLKHDCPHAFHILFGLDANVDCLTSV